MIQLSPARDQRKGVGYIPFLYLREAYRHKGLGIQLVGHAVSFYRKLGRTKLQLSVAIPMKRPLAFIISLASMKRAKAPEDSES